MLFSFAVLCLITISSALDDEIHKKLTDQQETEVFNKSHYNSVPDYQLVQFHLPKRDKRDVNSPRRLIVQFFGQNIEAYVYPGFGELATENTPVYEAYYDRYRGPSFRDAPNAMRNLGELWKDHITKTSLFVKRDVNGQYQMDGYIASKNLIVRSLPESINEDLRKRNVVNASNSLEHSAFHIVYEGKKDQLLHLVERDVAAIYNNGNLDYLQDTVIYPEIMVVIDSACFDKHGQKLDKMLAYILAFWNGVDMSYRNFRFPAIRIRISQIIIATSPKALPFIYDNRLNGFVQANPAWDAARNYFYQILEIFPARTYDAVMIMTGLRLTKEGVEEDYLGVAATGGMCQIYPNEKKVGGIGLSTEDAIFTNVLTVVHELGHLFNMSHDGQNNTCSEKLGYVMSPELSKGNHAREFSQCSIKAIDNYIQKQQLTCTYNEPNTKSPMPRILPGDLMDRDEQCVRLGYAWSCYDSTANHDHCGRIYCVKNGRCYKIHELPPDGAYCGQNKICVQGFCARKP